ncbi:centromere protein P isoform X3 [Oryzias melastigma]|uniref:centromere protein P isoform X3 n=1 Tax=Oryzias melastigma TaxID=30732 RepID=UPI000CF7FC6E|nr:centromere protein P isoform X3 [Oryzias melastigma]
MATMQEKTGEENGDEVKMLEGHIEDLRAEIASLQRQKEELNRDSMLHFEGAMLDALLIVGGQTQNRDEETVMFKLKEEVEELEKDLHLQTEMNGISVDDCKIKTLFSSGREWTHQVCVSLQCSQMVLQVDFQITETKVGRGSEKKIVGLNVVLDSDELQNFSGFLSRVEESLDLPLLFRTLRNFSDRCDERSRTFQHFQMRGAQSVASVQMFAPTPPVEALKYPPSSRSSLRETQNKDRREIALGTRVPAWEWSSSFCLTRK